jgi:hypothetical protein
MPTAATGLVWIAVLHAVQVLYFVCVLAVVVAVFQRTRLLGVLYSQTPKCLPRLKAYLKENIKDVQRDTLVFFCKRCDSGWYGGPFWLYFFTYDGCCMRYRCSRC